MLVGQICGWYDKQGNTLQNRNATQRIGSTATTVIAIPVADPFAVSDAIFPYLMEILFKLGETKMKKCCFIFLLFLNGCFYHDGCIYTPQMVNCVDKGKEFPYIAQYQKVNSIGHTNSQKRWQDAYQCGGENKNNDLRIKNVRDKNGNMNLEVLDKFENCMREKGYHRFWPAECGFQDPKWDKGVCNL